MTASSAEHFEKKHLGDSRRFVFFGGRGKLFLGDSQPKEVSERLSVSPDSFGEIAVAPGDSEIYFSMSTLESDIRLVELERETQHC